MYCISTPANDLEATIRLIREYPMAEIRLDLAPISDPDIKRLCEAHGQLIFTYRKTAEKDDELRLETLSRALHLGARWVDVDIDEEEGMLDHLKKLTGQMKKGGLILSYHHFERTPTNRFLYEILLRMQKYAPEFYKLACTSQGQRDNERILLFNQSFQNTIAFNMGDPGKLTRVACLDYGAPFTYVSAPGRATAPGQMDRDEMEALRKAWLQ